jgi:hypothetical protein
LYQYLDATQQFAVLDAAMPVAAMQSGSRKSLRKMSIYLGGLQQDQSIAQLFRERAEAGLTRSPDAAGWTSVEAIVEQVLPAYFAALKHLRLPSIERRLKLPSRWSAGPTLETCSTQQVC